MIKCVEECIRKFIKKESQSMEIGILTYHRSHNYAASVLWVFHVDKFRDKKRIFIIL